MNSQMTNINNEAEYVHELTVTELVNRIEEMSQEISANITETVAESLSEVIEQAREMNMKDKIAEIKARIEAILFLSEKPKSSTEIANQAGVDPDIVRQGLTQLIQEYEERKSGIVISCNKGYAMHVRDDYEDLSESILPMELRTACLRTLSTIALKEPLFQSELINLRGGGAYSHVKELIAMGLIKKRKEGNNNVLLTTKLFAEYFKLSKNGLELQHLLKKSVGDVNIASTRELELDLDVDQKEDAQEEIEADATNSGN